VRKAASEVLSWNEVEKIDILVNNAAMMNIPERTLSEDGIEIQFATNHIGHFLLTNLLLPKMLKSPAPRVVNVTSLSPTVAGIRWSDINFEKVNKTLPKDEQPPYEMHKRWGMKEPEEKSYLPLEGYNQSKVANVLFSIALTHRLYAKHKLLSIAVHPGVIQTELSRYAPPEILEAIKTMGESGAFVRKTLGAGASTSLVATVDPKLGMGGFEGERNLGAYMMDCQVSDRADGRAVSSEGAERLWGVSEGLVGEKFAW
jgi:NAD(P)-dependent dehydrogenase (short-subunit alcohol dehydrogenase family)